MTSPNLNHLGKAPPPNTSTLGIRISTHRFLRNTNMWSIAEDLGKPGVSGERPLEVPA